MADNFKKSAKYDKQKNGSIRIQGESLDGVTYVADETHKIKTAYPKEDFDPLTKRVVEVFK